MAHVWGNIVILVFAHFLGSQGNQCGEPTKYPDRRLEEKYRHISDFKHDDNVEYNCAPGYRRTGGSRISFCKEGRWTPSDLTCKKMSSLHGTKLRFSRQVDAACSIPSGKDDGMEHDVKTTFEQEEKVSITCRTGYNGSGLYTCLQNKTWDPRKPKCVRVKCPVIEIINGHRSPQRNRYNTTVRITCNPGFILRGAQYVHCELNGSWTPDVPKCEPDNCGPAPSYPHAHLRDEHSAAQREYKAEAVLRYKCNKGNISAGGRDNIYCRSGQWTVLKMTCKPKRCGPTEEILNGRIEYTGVSYGDKATVICNEGHEAIGRPVRYCRDGGWDGRNAECEPVYCPPPPLVKNADMFELTYEKVLFGNFVSYRCRTGSLIGAREIHCTKNGTWSAPPPECRDNCGPAPSYPHAHLRDEHSPAQREYKAEAVLRYKCNIGHISAGGKDKIYCRSGQWTVLKMTCKRKTCGPTEEILNGRIEYTGVSYGDKATVICNEGHEAIGRPVRHCRDGGWDGRNAECEPVYCPPPPLVKNADMFELTYEEVPFGNMVSYRCRTGSLIGATQIHCTKNGTWSAPPPECRDIVCPVPKLPAASGMMGYRSVYRFGDTVRINCNPRFRFAEEYYVKCGLDGEWTPEPSKVCRSSRVAHSFQKRSLA